MNLINPNSVHGQFIKVHEGQFHELWCIFMSMKSQFSSWFVHESSWAVVNDSLITLASKMSTTQWLIN